MVSPFGLHACYVYASILNIMSWFAANSHPGVEAFVCDRTSTTTMTTTAYYNEREQPLTICHGRASNEPVEKQQLHIFEVEETIQASNELAKAGGIGILTALVRTSYLSSSSSIAFIVTAHAVNLEVFLEGDGGLSKIYLITPWKTKSSVSVTSITTPSPHIIQLDCSEMSTHSTRLVYSATSRCEQEHLYRYFDASLDAVASVAKTERADEWIIDLR